MACRWVAGVELAFYHYATGLYDGGADRLVLDDVAQLVAVQDTQVGLLAHVEAVAVLLS